ncbi:MAG: PDZ domain-containing protein, partial [Anaerolineae bacterium]|nr:PDZ domain-containing protein [Anaerolineae bacterium]
GLSIDTLSEDSDLYAAGLREGDLITAVNGEAFDNSMGMMRQFMEIMTSEDPITLTIERDGESMDIEIDPGTLMDVFSGMPFHLDDVEGMMPFNGQVIPMPHGDFGFSFSGNQARLGVSFVTLDEQNAVEYDASATEGAYVIEVSADSPADQAGLQAGDVITAVDGDAVDAEHTLSDRIYAYEPGDVITLDVLRGDETLQIEVTLTSNPQQSGMMPFGQRGNGHGFNVPVVPSSPDDSNLFNFDAPEL